MSEPARRIATYQDVLDASDDMIAEIHRAGVCWLWLVDPAARTVEAYRREEGGYLRVAAVTGEGEARIPPFDAVGFELGAWWPGDEHEEP